MNRKAKRTGGAILAASLMTIGAIATAGRMLGGAGNPIYRPVIVAYGYAGDPDHTDGNNTSDPNAHPVQMNPVDGSSQQYIHNVNGYGDLTRGGGTRWVLDIQPSPAGEGIGTSIVAQSEDGTDGFPSYEATLFSDASFSIDQATWSVNGQRVAFTATSPAGRGIYVGEVVRDGLGQPVSLDNVRLALPILVAQNPQHAQPRPVWSGDNQRVTYEVNETVWVGNVDTGVSASITQAGQRERRPAFSPVAGDNRLVFSRYMGTMSVGGSTSERWDLFTYNTANGSGQQVTNKTKCSKPKITAPDWSPNGAEIAFSAGDFFLSDGPFVFRIPATGNAKAVQLTRTRVQNGSIVGRRSTPRWRD